MLSIEQCKKHLRGCNYTEKQIEKIRDSLYYLTSILVEKHIKKRRDEKYDVVINSF